VDTAGGNVSSNQDGACALADFAHHHPFFTIAGQIVLTCQAGGIPFTDDAYNPLVMQIVLEKIPGPLS
jgi:hypothetical protein